MYYSNFVLYSGHGSRPSGYVTAIGGAESHAHASQLHLLYFSKLYIRLVSTDNGLQHVGIDK